MAQMLAKKEVKCQVNGEKHSFRRIYYNGNELVTFLIDPLYSILKRNDAFNT